ncbi:MAG: hypothetical protein IJV21_01295, partial [Lachnospiraceae bacterium]|nr:hypothetical protein [Lachnospiraceae bacterium]
SRPNEADNPNNEYDYTDIYKEQIEPLINRIQQICIDHNMPVFFACAVKNKNGKTDYKMDGIMTGSNSIKLYQDYFEIFLDVGKLNLVPASKLTQFDESTLGADMMDYINNTQLTDDGEIDFEE